MRVPVALLVLLSFGCATVRVPSGSVEGSPPDLGEVADPKVELWLEGGSAASASETAEAQKAARDALAVAIAQRRVDVSALGAEDPVVIVRERAVTRTPARRREQIAAKVGMAAGVVAVAAAGGFAERSFRGTRRGAHSPPARLGGARRGAPARAAARPRRWCYPARRPGGSITGRRGSASRAPAPSARAAASDAGPRVRPGPPPARRAGHRFPPPPPPLPEMEKLPLDQRGFFD